MRIGFISTRLNGTDGVSLEVEKWAKVLEKSGHEIFYCAGELGGFSRGGTLIPQMHFAHHTIHALSQRAFGEESNEDPYQLCDEIYQTADEIRTPLRAFIRSNKLDLIIVQNALTIPMNLPLGICLTGLIAELGINTIAHHHDFFWERERYQANAVIELLETTFPAKLPSIQHVTINTIAQQRLKERRKIDSTVVPNVLDFNKEPNGKDNYNQDVYQNLNHNPQDYFILQPTRVIPRKGIEIAIELVHRLYLSNPNLYITHNINDEGLKYWNWLEHEAKIMGVNLVLLNGLVQQERGNLNGKKVYSLWDIYSYTNLVTYPSSYEGFGNALLEAVFYHLPVVINRYPVYNADIKPLGFNFIELDGFLSDQAMDEVKQVLSHPKDFNTIAKQNFEIARENFSMEVLKTKLENLISTF